MSEAGGFVAVLVIESPERVAFTADDEALLTIVATMVASAIAKENLPYSDAGSHRPAIIVRATSRTALPAVTVA